MGQCGCGNYNGQWRMPGPNGKWYVLSAYQGCQDCSTPAGIHIDLFDAEDMDLWQAGELPIVCDESHPYSGVPLIDRDKLAIALVKALDDAGVCLGEDEESRDECVEELELTSLIGGVVYDTAKSFDDQRRAALAQRTTKDTTP